LAFYSPYEKRQKSSRSGYTGIDGTAIIPAVSDSTSLPAGGFVTFFADGDQDVSEVDAAWIPGRYMADLVAITGRTAYPPVWLNGQTNHLNIRGLEGGIYFVRICRVGVLEHTGRLVIVK